MELFDLYTADRVKTGRTMVRGGQTPEGFYRLVVHVCIFNLEGKMLIQQRQPFKKGWSNLWDVTVGGSAISGDSSRSAAERETLEELGLSIDLTDIRPTMTIDEFSGKPKFSFDINAGNAQASLESILEYLQSRKARTVVAIDEFQQIAEYPEKGVEALLRSKMQFMHNVGFVFSGSRLHMMAEMFHSPKRPFFNSTASMSLDVIDRQAYFRFAASFFRKAGRILPEETFVAAYDRFEGITWYVQSVMKELYAMEVARPTEKDVIAAVGHLVEENAMNYGFVLSKCSPGAVELLRAVAAERVVAEPMSAEFGRKYGLRAASSVRFALDSLLDDELLYRREDGYVVYDRLFAEWLRT